MRPQPGSNTAFRHEDGLTGLVDEEEEEEEERRRRRKKKKRRIRRIVA